eukprot:TRINITY_DN60325_c0_g1_i1.p1 TRINITY_DN60325_c0_g1~~TRINITY_DN60325_c0_g1_i1.p1  ORF type:complete len:375 (-),score=87.66 TRINITY_DN60325_c0_g1_i1:106-1230(-)
MLRSLVGSEMCIRDRFRCMVCPDAFCEDHLPPSACIVGKNERLEALGANHPKQGCYVFCSGECVTFAHAQGLATEEVIQATASMVLGTTGVDLTKKKIVQAKLVTDTRSEWDKLTEIQARDLEDAMRYRIQPIHQVLQHFDRSMRNSSHFGSAVDLLHDAVFGTERYWHAVKGQDPEPALERLGDWAGVSGELGRLASKEEAAVCYLNLSREFSDSRSYYRSMITYCLEGLGFASTTIPTFPKLCKLGSKCSRAEVVHALALFLTWPNVEATIVLPNRSSESRTLITVMREKLVPRQKSLSHPLHGVCTVFYPTHSMNDKNWRPPAKKPNPNPHPHPSPKPEPQDCLLYTSDAADEEDSVDLGGRRIIKKKKKK